MQYLVVPEWDKHLPPDYRKKCKAPYRWCKLYTENLDDLGDLTCREFGAYCRLLMLAAVTDNRLVYKPSWIRRRSGVSREVIDTLLNRNLVELIDGPEKFEKTITNQALDADFSRGSGESAAKPSPVEGKGKGREKNRREGIAPPGLKPDGRQPTFKVMTQACQDAGVAGSDWNAISTIIKKEFNFLPTEKQLSTLQRQLNDRSGH